MAVIGLQEVPDIYPASKSAQSTSLSFAGAYDDSFLMLSHRNGVSPAPVRSLQHLVFKVADTKAGIERARAAGALIRPEPAQAHGMAWHGMANIVAAASRDPDGNAVELVQMRN